MTKPIPTTPAGDPTTIPALKAWYADRERALVAAALERTAGNQLRTASELGITVRQLHGLLERHGLSEAANTERGRPRKAAQ